jgi:hypothetical protein
MYDLPTMLLIVYYFINSDLNSITSHHYLEDKFRAKRLACFSKNKVKKNQTFVLMYVSFAYLIIFIIVLDLRGAFFTESNTPIFIYFSKLISLYKIHRVLHLAGVLDGAHSGY